MWSLKLFPKPDQTRTKKNYSLNGGIWNFPLNKQKTIKSLAEILRIALKFSSRILNEEFTILLFLFYTFGRVIRKLFYSIEDKNCYFLEIYGPSKIEESYSTSDVFGNIN